MALIECCCTVCGKRHQCDTEPLPGEKVVFGYLLRMCPACFAIAPQNRDMEMSIRVRRMNGKEPTVRQQKYLDKKARK